MIRGLKHLCNAPAHSAVLGEDHLIYSDKCTGEATKILGSFNNKLVINPQRVNRVNIFSPLALSEGRLDFLTEKTFQQVWVTPEKNFPGLIRSGHLRGERF